MPAISMSQAPRHCLLVAFLACFCVIWNLLGTFNLLLLSLATVSTGFATYIVLQKVLSQGLLRRFGPKLRQILTQKSIYDIYSDIVYFPTVTKIIAAFAKGAISKPEPEKLHEVFAQLPMSYQRTIFTKGLLNLTPQSLQQLVLAHQNPVQIAPKYGSIEPVWYNRAFYEQQVYQPHLHTPIKETLRTLDAVITWPKIITVGCALLLVIKSSRSPRLRYHIFANACTASAAVVIIGIAVKLIVSKRVQKIAVQNKSE